MGKPCLRSFLTYNYIEGHFVTQKGKSLWSIIKMRFSNLKKMNIIDKKYKLQTDDVNKMFPLYFKIANWYRNRRIRFFILLFELAGNETILDVGGNYHFWHEIDITKNITLLNLKDSDIKKQYYNENIKCVFYNGGKFPFDDKEFDIVFSNSTIEHVGDFFGKREFAEEILRVGKRFFLQTPSFWSPYEPHAMIPLFQFMPGNLQILLNNYFKKSPYCIEELLSIKLLTRRELQYLFPDAIIKTERLLFLPKSYYVYNLNRAII